MEGIKVVSLIPARGGSERIPKKNIKVIVGKPMIAWTIEASLKSKYIDRTFVSTEDKEIKGVALRYGAEVIDRPLKYASDINAEFNGIIAHFRESMERLECYPDYLVFLHATSPLRTFRHIDEAMELLLANNCDLLVSFTPLSHNPRTHIKTLDEKGVTEYIIDFERKHSMGRKFKKVYYANGAISIGTYQSYNYYATTYSPVLAYIISPEDSIDVDTPFDFKVAEMILKERIAKEAKKI